MEKIALTRRGKIVASVLSGALVIGGCAGAALALVQSASPPVPVLADYGPGDGLARYELSLDPGVRQLDVDLVSAHLPPSADATATATPTAVELLGEGGRVVQVGSTPYYVTERGAVSVAPGAPPQVLSPVEFAQWAAQNGVAVPPHDGAAAAPTASPAPSAAAASPSAAVTASATDAQLEALEDSPGVVSAQRLRDGRVLVATTLTLAEVQALPDVEEAVRAEQVAVHSGITDPRHADAGWALENTGSNASGWPATAGADAGALTGWTAGQGEGSVVAVIDTGYDTDHPDLVGALWDNPAETCGSADTDRNGKAGDCHGWNFTTNNADLDNGAGGRHGTLVAGTVAARLGNGEGGAGLAPQARVMPLVAGSGGSVFTALAIEAIYYAADHGADVINASYGGRYTAANLASLRAAVAYAAERDVLVVTSAGNDTGDRDTDPHYPASLTEANVITVGASTPQDGVADFSAYGANSVDLFAPGWSVLTTAPGGGYEAASGTSFSSPYTAAAVALYASARPDLTALDIRSMLLADTERIPAFAGRSVTGGRLDLTTLGATTGGARYAFSSMKGAVDALSPKVGIEYAGTAGDYSVALGLAMKVDGRPWALADAAIGLGGTTQLTGDDGFTTFDLGARGSFTNEELAPALTLGEGTYALVVQLLKDDAPVGRPYAAPLGVGPVGSAPRTTTPGPSATGTASPSASASGTPVPSASGSATPVPSGSASGSPTAGPSASGTPTSSSTTTAGPRPTSSPRLSDVRPAPAPTTTPTGGGGPTTAPAPTRTASTAPSAQPTGTPTASASGPSSPSATSRPSSSPSSSSTARPSSSSSGGAPTGSPTTVAPAPTPGGSSQFPEVGDYRVTGMSPVRVPVTGGTTVTVTGQGFDANTEVHIGGVAASYLSSSATRLVVRTPARVAGTYDVIIHQGIRESTLTRAMTYYAVSSGAPSASATSAPTSSAPAPGGPSATPTGGATTSPATAPSASSSTTPSALPTQRTGPNGERLRSTPFMDGVGDVWRASCTGTCSGTRLGSR